MKRIFTYILILIFTFFCGYVTSNRQHHNLRQNQTQIIDTLIITKVDTFTQKVYTPLTYSVIATDTVKIYDTIRAISDFGSIHIYNDTLRIDSLAQIFIIDTLQFNRIRSRSFSSVYKTTEKTVFVNSKPKPHISAGVGVAYSDKVAPFATIQYSKNRNNVAIQAGENYYSVAYAYQLW